MKILVKIVFLLSVLSFTKINASEEGSREKLSESDSEYFLSREEEFDLLKRKDLYLTILSCIKKVLIDQMDEDQNNRIYWSVYGKYDGSEQFLHGDYIEEEFNYNLWASIPFYDQIEEQLRLEIDLEVEDCYINCYEEEEFKNYLDSKVRSLSITAIEVSLLNYVGELSEGKSFDFEEFKTIISPIIAKKLKYL